MISSFKTSATSFSFDIASMIISRLISVLFASIMMFITISDPVRSSENLLSILCPNHTVYSLDNVRNYRSNLKSNLLRLNSSDSKPNGFYNFSSGSGNPTSYVLLLCRGDITPKDCDNCKARASLDTLGFCENVTRANIWYENCMVRHSDQSIFSQIDTGEWWYFKILQNVSNPALLNQVLGKSFGEVIRVAKDDVSGKKVAFNVSSFTAFQNVYTMAQCTPDISNLECETCLSKARTFFPSCCDSLTEGRVYFPSCNLRYDTNPFFQIPAPPVPPATLNLPSPRPQSSPNLSSRPSSILAPTRLQDDGKFSTITIVAITIPAVVAVVAFVVLVFCIVMRTKKKTSKPNSEVEITGVLGSISTDAESLRYSIAQVQAYTNNFSVENQIGKGGFGLVFKGTLPNGQIVAVKRLSKTSSQGGEEFINEISLVAKLQHKHLVKLLGYCLEGGEKILIYEFAINKSLDYFLFDPKKQSMLDWLTRYKIIRGIARGILYLHEDSRIKIIHRDLKAGNVLLDQDMNAKIADFGMARLFKIDQSEGNTSKIAGTFGYMAPEYMFHGTISVKLDVFSFGVLVLEIISGKKISNLQCFGVDDLLSYTWKNWRDGTPLAVMDPSIGESYNKNEVTRCIHIGLLCVVEDMDRRPTMTSVVQLLNNYSIPRSTPNPPAFFGRSRTGKFFSEIHVADYGESSFHQDFSTNQATITELYPRS